MCEGAVGMSAAAQIGIIEVLHRTAVGAYFHPGRVVVTSVDLQVHRRALVVERIVGVTRTSNRVDLTVEEKYCTKT